MESHEHEHEHIHTHEHEHNGHEHIHEHCHTHTHEHVHNHCEDEDHEHLHEGHLSEACEHHHHHDHIHGHSHEVSADGENNLSKEEKTLGILLDHWVEHNKSHEEGFQEWIDKSKAMGKTETADFIKKAVAAMEEANEMLIEAKKNM